MMQINIKWSAGPGFEIEVEEKTLIEDFKKMLAEDKTLVLESVRLVCSGKLLKDGSSLADYGLKEGAVIHMVGRKIKTEEKQVVVEKEETISASVPAAAPVPAAQPSQTRQQQPSGYVNHFASFGSGSSNMAEMMRHQQEMLRQNPEMMRQMMQDPSVQQIMANPEALRNMMQGNPMIESLVAENPELATAFENPEMIQQMQRAMTDPAYQTQLQQQMDNSLLNMENMPAIHAAHRSMTQAEEAAAGRSRGEDRATAESNLNATLRETDNQMNQHAPNTDALPNPWAAAAAPGMGGPAAPQMFNPMMGNPMGGAMGGAPDMAQMQQMMENPIMRQMISGVLSNPDQLEAMTGNRELADMMRNNPMMRQMFSNPDTLVGGSQMLTPEAMQQAEQMRAMMGGGAPMGDFGMGGMGNFPFAPRPSADTRPPAERFAAEVAQLREMGFYDEAENLRVLTITNGNVNAAVAILLG